MANPQIATPYDAEFNHRRTKSSALKSFIHKRSASKGAGLIPTTTLETAFPVPIHNKNAAVPLLPLDHPHAMPLGELHQNQYGEQSSPKKSRDGTRPATMGEENKPLHKKSKSTVSLKSLAGRDGDKKSKQKEERPASPKKIKSSSTFATLLTRPKSARNLKKAAEEAAAQDAKDKENRTPPSSTSPDLSSRPPIFAQFSSQAFSTQPLGGKFLEDEIDLYTPDKYSPNKQRNFYGGYGSQPTLARKEESKRPKSTYLPSSFSIQDLSAVSRRSHEQPRKASIEVRPGLDRKTTAPETRNDMTMARRGAKVMAAVAAFGGKAKASEICVEPAPEIEDIDAEFEAMLDRRNIPENQRHKMRSLATPMKLDFVKQDRAEAAATKTSRPGTRGSEESADGVASGADSGEAKKRGRSRTFTIGKSSKDSTTPSKKSKPEGTLRGHSRSKSSESVNGGKTITFTGVAVASTLIAKAKGQTPDDFVAYLRKVQKPELVEVGKLHKLRLLLRNETVAWTDEFIGLGGMKEIVGLLHRTMEVEWREEHEDALLHEVLLCLKALCTTALALYHLSTIQATLFPALIHLLFDPEHKGPSEFTTRNIITSLLFTYLKSAPVEDRTNRALVLLSYLRDPKPKEEETPVPFVLEMHKERPYRVWGKEVVNVTKEVFWIFLHNLNVISLPPTRSNTDTIESSGISVSDNSINGEYAYMTSHFPPELPPVPAAPYVGGVEWDATNYLASHLDLLNGILACLPLLSDRNTFREQLKVSGWERVMGSTLRTCKEKFYGGVHAGLRTWVAAAVVDGWDVRDVRCGPVAPERVSSPRKSPMKKTEEAPRLEMPKLDFGRGVGGGEKGREENAWL